MRRVARLVGISSRINLLSVISKRVNLSVRLSSSLSSPVPIHKPLQIKESSSSGIINMSDQYKIPNDQPIVSLDCCEAFNGLSDKEKNYAHYLSKASWTGSLVVLVQTSPESPILFSVLFDMFKTNGIEALKNVAVNECGFSEDDWRALLVYTTALFSNMGNYKGFGDTKFIPGVEVEKLDKLIGKAKFSNGNVGEPWESVKKSVYSLDERHKQLGLGDKGISMYFSGNCATEDSDLVLRFLKKQKLEAWNTRCFKVVGSDNSITYEIRSASVEQDPAAGCGNSFDFEGAKFILTKGDYSPLLSLAVNYLKTTKEFAANETEKQMLECYMESFITGSIDGHKNGSRHWIKNKLPAIETYIGFIENYRDPSGVRAEFEGFVAVTNREMSKKFGKLVDGAPDYLKLLPWPTEFEKDTFLKPDFTSLDVLTFGGSGIPAGINIPNYDEIRQTEGFKNVSLGNVIPASYKETSIPFLSAEDQAVLIKYRIPAFEVQVGLHELLGHGSGKILQKNEDGSTNYSSTLKNPLNDKLVDKCYDCNDNYDSVFGAFASGFEECRAECVGLYLSLNKGILKDVFGFDGEVANNILYANWLSMVFAGSAKALEMYQPSTKQWMQAHSQARFAILQVLIEAGENLVSVQEKTGADGKPDLLIQVDGSKLDTVGRKAIGDFLLKIQVYKATANAKEADEMFSRYTAVHNDGKYPWAKWRDIIMDKKQPRKYFVQHNTVAEGSSIALKTYPATPEGVIQSWIERFDGSDITTALNQCWAKDKHHFVF